MCLYIYLFIYNFGKCKHMSLSPNNFLAKIINLSSPFAIHICLNDDRYTQLVEQFAAVSYGDEVFGHFILVPLQQHHSPSYRKLVWSEHAAVLRVLRTRPEQVIMQIMLLRLQASEMCRYVVV